MEKVICLRVATESRGINSAENPFFCGAAVAAVLS